MQELYQDFIEQVPEIRLVSLEIESSDIDETSEMNYQEEHWG